MFDMSQWFCLTLWSLFVCRLTLAKIIWKPEHNHCPRRKQLRYGISAPLIRTSARESRLLRITRTTTWFNLPDLATTNFTDKQSGLDPNTVRNSARAYAWDVMMYQLRYCQQCPLRSIKNLLLYSPPPVPPFQKWISVFSFAFFLNQSGFITAKILITLWCFAIRGYGTVLDGFWRVLQFSVFF